MATHNKNRNLISKNRIIAAFTMFIVLLLFFAWRVAYIQVVKSNEYSKMAVDRQKRDIVLTPVRGKILDRNGEELAVSIDSFTVWLNKEEFSSRLAPSLEIKKSKPSKDEILEANAGLLAEKIGKKKEDIVATVKEVKHPIFKIAKNMKKEEADEISNLRISGISISDEPRRYYPLGDFLSHTLGSTRDDNEGLSGIELQYNKYLAGVEGRWVKDTDTSGKALASGDEKYFKPEDGDNVVLTIDQVIQNYTEKSVREYREKYKAYRASCIIMDVKTGEILSMASYPSFDPNNSKEPSDEKEKEKFDKMENEEKIKYLNEMWRNPLISDIYEPGSTAKLITASASLEEGVSSKNKFYYCDGAHTIDGIKVKCWSYLKPHGTQNMYESIGNSCNPALMQMGTELGKDKFYDYTALFGLTEKTGVDFPGEAEPIILKKEDAKPVDLGVMSFGQTNAVTPVQLVTAISAIGNDGKLMKPHLLKKIVDKNGNTIKEIEPVMVRQAISKETADEMRKIMQFVVHDSTGKAAKIPGYNIGGKTGTSEVVGKDGRYTFDVIASFIGMVPMEDPQFAILYIIDKPEGGVQGSQSSAIATKELMEKILKYKDIKPHYTDEEKGNIVIETVPVPSVKGMKLSEAKTIIENLGLKYKVTPKQEDNKDFVIKEQFPKSGEQVVKNGVIYLYRE